MQYLTTKGPNNEFSKLQLISWLKIHRVIPQIEILQNHPDNTRFLHSSANFQDWTIIEAG
jgi:hypothetical protein